MLRRARLWAALVLVIGGLLAPTAASAGTLTSATFTTAGTGYATTNTQNARYDWAFTTATSGTVSKVNFTVPLGTQTPQGTYLYQAGSTSYASAPAASVPAISGDMDVRVKASLTNWRAGTYQTLVAKRYYGQFSYSFMVNNANNLEFSWNDPSLGQKAIAYTVPAGWTANSIHYLRATFTAATSAVTFYESYDNGATWTSLYSYALNSTTSISASTANVTVGACQTYSPITGRVYYAEVRSGVNGTVVASFDPTLSTIASPGSWTSNSPSHETWTIAQASSPKGDIAYDLTANITSGLPTGGTAMYRMIDGAATYTLPTVTTVPSGTAVAIGLTGFTNTATPGSYTSTITTYDNSATPAAIDSATTGSLVFSAASNSTAMSATIDPTFTFTVANQSSACNGESNFVTTAGSATGVSLGHLSTSANTSGGQALTVAANAGGGFSVYVRGAQSSQNLRSSTRNWTDASGTYSSPAALGSGEAFGYTYKDSTTSSSVTNPASANFIALDGTNRAVSGSTTASVGNSCVSYDAQTGSVTSAGSYSATIVYVALPTF